MKQREHKQAERSYTHPLTGEVLEVDAELQNRWLDGFNRLRTTKGIRLMSICAGHNVEPVGGGNDPFYELRPHVMFDMPPNSRGANLVEYVEDLADFLPDAAIEIEWHVWAHQEAVSGIHVLRIRSVELRPYMTNKVWAAWFTRVLWVLRRVKLDYGPSAVNGQQPQGR